MNENLQLNQISATPTKKPARRKAADKIPSCWMQYLKQEFSEPYMLTLKNFLETEIKAKKVVYPPMPHIFRSLELTPWDKVKVVIVGQDPYHGPGQAQGLSFSVPREIPAPPSLVNIQKELMADLGADPKQIPHDLTFWAEQGVLLLNSVLTVEHKNPGSHANRGWEKFTDAVIRSLAFKERPIVFLLWGSYAQKKAAILENGKHCFLKAPHPSPLSAHRGFMGCKHFSKANQFLEESGVEKIAWIES